LDFLYVQNCCCLFHGFLKTLFFQTKIKIFKQTNISAKPAQLWQKLIVCGKNNA